MSSNTATTCTHPVRDLVIVVLGGLVVGLFAFIAVTQLGGQSLDALKAAGTSWGVFSGAGLVGLQHLKRN
ncbi:hypothetical protein OG361_30180 [Streptomyces sp. NBC_00090]|uniref:hypothetical protein n=1 Tax=Streptomyces sp. NBC_00090 TaxID=2903619 RepID=UPI00324AA45A